MHALAWVTPGRIKKHDQ